MRHLDRQITALREQQAANWVSKLAKADSSEQAEFVAWLKESPHNVREYLIATCIEQSLDGLDGAHDYDIDALLKQRDASDARISQLPKADIQAATESAQSTQTNQNTRRWWFAAAASVAFAASLGGWMLFQWRYGWQEFHTGIGEQRTLQLQDGSVVYMNANSRVSVRLSNDIRDVKLLDGEALFKVHHDEARPFRVLVRDAVIRDIGTQFNVYSRADSTKVAVIEGSVEVIPQMNALQSAPVGSAAQINESRAAAHTLIANQQARISAEGAVAVLNNSNINESIAWQQRRLVFRDDSLSHIAATFNQYNHRLVRVDDGALASRRYSGTFDADDPESLALVLADDPGVTIDRSEDEIVIRTNRR